MKNTIKLGHTHTQKKDYSSEWENPQFQTLKTEQTAQAKKTKEPKESLLFDKEFRDEHENC